MTEQRFTELWKLGIADYALREALTALVEERAMRRKAEWKTIHLHCTANTILTLNPDRKFLDWSCRNETQQHDWTPADWITAEWERLGVKP